MHPTFLRVLLAAALAAAGSPAVATEIQLEQGWNAEQRASWYDASLGSRLLPLAWAQALERPDSEERLFSEDNARRLGFPCATGKAANCACRAASPSTSRTTASSPTPACAGKPASRPANPGSG